MFVAGQCGQAYISVQDWLYQHSTANQKLLNFGKSKSRLSKSSFESKTNKQKQDLLCFFGTFLFKAENVDLLRGRTNSFYSSQAIFSCSVDC